MNTFTQARSIKSFFSLFNDYAELCKPRVVMLMLLTAWVGMFLTESGILTWQLFVFATVGIGLMASAAATINHLVDQKIDAMMNRTRHRPLPTGRISTQKAIIFSSLLGIVGFTLLWGFVNTLTAWLTFASLMGYAVLYTLYLKRATPQNIVIGGLAGALPPLLGAVAVTGEITANALQLVIIIFVWTPPHFWALALYRLEEYKKAKIPMLPVTHGIEYTILQILLYTVLLCVVSLLPFLTQMSGLIYLVGVVILNGIFLTFAISLWRLRSMKIAYQMFQYSILYLMLLFGLLLVDHYV